MKTITFQCEVITPMFLAGADGKTPELRPPSIKGAMRFWWRAMHGHLSLAELKKKESEIFGGGGDKARRSSFSIVVSHKQITETKMISLTPHHRKGYCNSYNKNCSSFKAWTQECNKAKKQEGVLCKFDLQIDYNEFIINKDDLVNLIKTTFLLGGLGKRSRRGFGSVKLKDEYNITTLKQVQNFINKINYTTNNNYPTIKNIEISKTPYNNYEDLLIKIGELTHSASFKPEQKDVNGVEIKRYASPSIISVIQVEDKFYPIVTSLAYNVNNFIYQNFQKFELQILM